MSRGAMMLMLRRMGSQLWIDHAAQQHQPGCQYPYGQSLSQVFIGR